MCVCIRASPTLSEWMRGISKHRQGGKHLTKDRREGFHKTIQCLSLLANFPPDTHRLLLLPSKSLAFVQISSLSNSSGRPDSSPVSDWVWIGCSLFLREGQE
jgi:hypothetical protein